MLSLALTLSRSSKKLDVHNAFFNSDLIEDVFMEQPSGVVSYATLMHVCKLCKALYALKQSPRAWYNKLSSFLLWWGFTIPNLAPLFIHILDHQLLS